MSQLVDTLAGEWAGTVIYGPKVQEFTVVFAEDGTVALTTTETTGHGTWSATGSDTFEIALNEKLNHGDSGVSGDTVVTGIDHLVVRLEARVDGGSFEGGGSAEVYDAEGNMIFNIAAQISGWQLVPNN
jgi:hypothetical protein